jgi:hypothetical protein
MLRISREPDPKRYEGLSEVRTKQEKGCDNFVLATEEMIEKLDDIALGKTLQPLAIASIECFISFAEMCGKYRSEMFAGYNDLADLARRITETFIQEYELEPEDKSAFFFFQANKNARFAALSGKLLPHIYYLVFAFEANEYKEDLQAALWEIAQYITEAVESCRSLVITIDEIDLARNEAMRLCGFRQCGSITNAAPSGKNLLLFEAG